MLKNIEKNAPSMHATGDAATPIKSRQRKPVTGLNKKRTPQDSLKRCDYLTERLNVYVFAALYTYKNDPVNRLWAMKKARDRAGAIASMLSRMITNIEMETARHDKG